MRNKLLLVADLGCLKAYRVTHDGVSSSPQIELVDTVENFEGRAKLTEVVTDEAGRFQGGMPGVSANGERHNIDLELTKRSIRGMAKTIATFVKNEPDDLDCWFAASKEINHQILDQLPPPVRSRIVKSIPEDLTRVKKGDLLRHFMAEQVVG